MRVATSKKQALSYKSEGISYGYEAGLIQTLEWFLTDIGAEKHLSSKEDRRLIELKHFHEKLSVENRSFPDDIPFDIVYPRFFTAVVNNSVERKGNNVSALIGAFRKWIAESEQLDKLRAMYHERYPEARPKALQTRASIPVENGSAEWVKGLPLEKQPDELIIDQHKKITTMMADEKSRGWLKKVEQNGGRGYIAKIMKEIKKRDLIVTK